MGWISHLCLMNMKRRKTRTFLTILGVVIGVISVVTLLAVGIGVRQEMINTMVDSESICRSNRRQAQRPDDHGSDRENFSGT